MKNEFDLKEEVLIECSHDADILQGHLERLRARRKSSFWHRWALAVVIFGLIFQGIIDVADFDEMDVILPVLLIVVAVSSHSRSIMDLHRIQTLRLMQDEHEAQ
jgi:hypothetical protein